MKELLIGFLKKAEGFNAKAYNDSEGLPTVGYGRLLTTGGPGWNGEKFANIEDFNSQYPDGISEAEAEAALESDAKQGVEDAKRLVTEAGHDWDWLSPVRQVVLVSAAFNLGYSRFKRFGGVWRGLEGGDHAYVAIEMLDSLRARQIKRRAVLEAIAYLSDDARCLEIPE